jgi:hypothetical protein
MKEAEYSPIEQNLLDETTEPRHTTTAMLIVCSIKVIIRYQSLILMRREAEASTDLMASGFYESGRALT